MQYIILMYPENQMVEYKYKYLLIGTDNYIQMYWQY